MAVKIKGTGKNKALTHGNAAIDGDILGPFMPSLPLIEGENEADYQALSERCLKGIKPKDAVEVVWAQDFIDYTWEAQRLKGMKPALIEEKKCKAVERLIRDYGDTKMANMAGPLSKEWSRREQETVEYVEALFDEHGLSDATVMAKAVEGCLETLECFDKLIASYDHRRDAGLRELEKRRDSFAKRAREFGETTITDVEPEELEAVVEPEEPEDVISPLPAEFRH